jgi:hypothetical protein
MRYGVDAVPHVCDVCFVLFYLELVDKISPAFELRNSGVPAVAIPAVYREVSTGTPVSILCRLVTAYHWHTFLFRLALDRLQPVLT